MVTSTVFSREQRVQILREGKVWYRHITLDDKSRGTVAMVKVGDMVYGAVALCSKKDQFSKHLGRMISLDRLAKSLNIEYKTQYITKYSAAIVAKKDLSPTEMFQDALTTLLDQVL